MLPKTKARLKAIELRKHGLSYSEIRIQVPVSQASLSLWLRNVQLNAKQQEVLLMKKISGQKLGASIRKEQRKTSSTNIIKSSSEEIDKISTRELWLLGIIAYWCEGSKQKEGNVSQRVTFTNSDPFLIKLFVKWVKEFCFVSDQDIIWTLCIHESGNVNLALEYWSGIVSINKECFNISLKKHRPLTVRKNTGAEYFGLLRVTIRRSTVLNRKIKGWVLGISNFT